MEDLENHIAKRVEECYHIKNMNCERTTLRILPEIFGVEPTGFEKSTRDEADSRGFCGLVIGGLRFLRAWSREKSSSDEDTEQLCTEYIESFKAEFGSVHCRDLVKRRLQVKDPSRRCESLIIDALVFGCGFIKKGKEV